MQMPSAQKQSQTSKLELLQRHIKKCIKSSSMQVVAPHTWVLGNERSREIEAAFKQYNVEWYLVPPQTHLKQI